MVLLDPNACFLITLPSLHHWAFSKFVTSNLSLITMEMKSSHKQSQRQALKSVQQSSSASPFMSFHVLDEPLR